MNTPKKSILIAIVIIFLIIVGSYFLSNYSYLFQNIFSSFKSSAGDSAKDYYTRGIKLYKQNEYDRAMAEFKKAIEKDPGYHKAYIKIHTISNERKNLDSARIYFEKLREKYPDVSCPYFTMGLVQTSKKDYQGAIENYQKAIQLNPKFASSYSMLADAFNQVNQLDEAIEWIKSIVRSNSDDPFAAYGLACVSRLLADWNGVFVNLDKSIKLDSTMLDAYNLKAKCLRDIGNLEEALRIGLAAIEIEKNKNEPEQRLVLLSTIGTIYYRLGEYDLAKKSYEEGLVLSIQLADKLNKAGILNNISIVYRGWGELYKAKNCFIKVKSIGNEIGSYPIQIYALSNLGDVYLELANYDSGLACLQQSLIGFREIKEKLHEAETLGSIAAAYSYMADYSNALKYGEQAIMIYRELGNKSGEAIELGNIGAIYYEIDNYTKAFEYYNRALTIANEIDEKYLQQLQINGISNIFHSLRDFPKALDYLEQALKIAQKMEDRDSQGECLLNIAITEYESGDIIGSKKHLGQALKLFIEIGNKRGEGIALVNLANINAEFNDHDQALQNYKAALKIAEDNNNKLGEAYSLNQLGMLYLKLEEYVNAAECHQKALVIGKEIKSVKSIWEATFGLGKAYEKQQKLIDALTYYK